VLLLVACHLSPVTASAAHLEHQDGLPIVYLEGSPYELGRQHGELLRPLVQHSVQETLGYFRGYLKLSVVGRWIVNWWLDRPWALAMPSIPSDYLEELRGLADGSGVPLRELWRLHAIPDRTYACSSFAAWGRATADGALIQARNLDWNVHVGIQRYAAVFVVRPRGKHAFVNAGWAGFIGVLTGVNDREISIGQVGAATLDVNPRGIPMTFLMRRVLEEADRLDAAVALVRQAPRTVGVNYIIADAKAKRAVAMETTARDVAVFEANDAREHRVSYAKPLVDVVLRSDTAMNSRIRGRQLASKGEPAQPGLERPSGSAYTVRYRGQAEAITAHYGRLDAEAAITIARSAAPPSNVQSVVIAWPYLWVANAHGTIPAAQTTYHRLDLQKLFGLFDTRH